MKTYAEKLRDPKWQKKRLDILNRDEFTCRRCGDKESTLNVHHKVYNKGKAPWDYDDDILITLCESCHEEVEGIKRKISMILGHSKGIDSEISILAEVCQERDMRTIFLNWAVSALSRAANYRINGCESSDTDVRTEAIEDFRTEIQDAARHCYEALFDMERNCSEE